MAKRRSGKKSAVGDTLARSGIGMLPTVQALRVKLPLSSSDAKLQYERTPPTTGVNPAQELITEIAQYGFSRLVRRR